jgi:site-specific DNA-methyltransferase (adenine-specific)
MKATDKITITNEDNMELMARYPDSYFDLAIVDPPYGIGESNKKQRTRKKHVNRVIHAAKSWDNSAPKKTYFKELERVSKNRIVWGANYFTNHLPPSMAWVFWEKKIGGDFSDGELAYTSFNKALKMVTQWSGGANKIHPTQKPVKLYEWLLDNYAKEGDKILDTHLGSGSIAISCHNRGFELTACELDKEYYNAAIKRIKQSTAQKTIFDEL